MKISVIGLGYVGLVSAVCFKRMGHRVIGVDIDERKVASIRLKKNPLPRVKFLGSYIKNFPFEALFDEHKRAIMETDITFVCVETPTKDNGSIDLSYLKKACKSIGEVLRNKKYHVVVIRSTIFPGSLEILKDGLEKASGKVCGVDFDLATNPEFLREIHAIKDFFNPSYVVVGADKLNVGKKIMGCYKGVKAKKFITDNGVAQMIKYANNTWHGCKVAFTNEIAKVCDATGVDRENLMALFREDTKLNISPYYHKPGKAYGGHCLPKDIAVLQREGRRLKLNNPLINSISKSNEIQEKIDKEEM